ncbi:uncharacterized protein LOC130636560 [Hydractinia symbiolongicarpus]|uniref:uncharacterized protein LOC130636560 n=1 Tax=Hydractinia symbiolongicarpus TaxID=13093 RepID=UPI00254F4C4E|nr:uncharacterized protein LOC130636560 [Hydractinia symbiolongicarpus]
MDASEQEEIQLLSRAFEENERRDETEEQDSLIQPNNSTLLSANWASVFMCGEMIGASSLSLPKALQNTGFYTGLVIYVIITCISGTFAYILSKTYATLRRDVKEYLNGAHIRDPYPQISHFVLGRKVRLLVIGCIFLSDFLGTAALILLPADMIVRSFEIKILPNHSVKQNMRLWVTIGTIVITPFTWNDRPKDNKFVGMLALCSALLGNILIVVLFILVGDLGTVSEPSNNPESATKYILAIGLLLTTADGFDILPNIQEDMQNANEYKKVIIRSYLLFSALTIPVMVGGYLLFHKHHTMSENLIIELVHVGSYIKNPARFLAFRVIAYATLVLYVVHIKMSTVLQLNPTFQYMERLFPCREGLCWQRCLLRSTILFLVLIFVIAAPELLPILSFNGSILYVILGVVIPGLMYIRVFDYIAIARKSMILSIMLIFVVYLSINSYCNIKEIFGKITI